MSPFIPNETPASWVTCTGLILTVHLLPASSDPRETQCPVPTCSGPVGPLKPLVSTLGVTWLKLRDQLTGVTHKLELGPEETALSLPQPGSPE